MGEFKHRFVNTNGIRMHVAESGEGYPVVMCPTTNKGHDRRDDIAPAAFWKFFSSF